MQALGQGSLKGPCKHKRTFCWQGREGKKEKKREEGKEKRKERIKKKREKKDKKKKKRTQLKVL